MKSFLFFLCLLPLFSFAQTSSISGRVIGEDKGPLEFINVVLQNTSDSSIVKAVASDATGSFNIENLREGSYFLQFSYVGFEALFTEPFQLLESEEKTLGNQTLVVKSESLNEIEVAFTKPLVEVKADRTIFNVEGTANAIGLNALELLRKAPGVMVDNNDKIMVKGKAGITVYIDGKLTPMDSDGLAAMLKNMQSSNIESIEIITNPSAKYDAAGNAGIINIKLKKNKNFGTNGSVSAGYAIQKYAKYNTSINLNHRNAKWNLFGLYGNNWGNYWNYMNLDRRQNETSYSQRTNMRSGGLKQNFKLGADYFINSKNTIGVMVSGNMGQNNNLNTSKTFIGNTAQTQIDSVLIAESNTNGERNNIGFNLNYRFADTLGHELNVDADYGIYDIFSNTYQPNSYFNPSENILTSERNYQNNTTTDISISSLKADYEQNLLKGKLSGGFKFSQVETLNKLDFFNFVDNAMVLDSNKTNKFNYSELISAGYLNYNRIAGKWGFQGGVRAEHTTSAGVLTAFTSQNDARVDRKYLNFFPSAAITYTQSDKSVFNLTFSRRIDRPGYQDLNPFEFRLDELSSRKGNAFLQSQYSNAVTLSHTFMYMVNTSISLSRTNGFFTEITDTTGSSRSYLQVRNLGYQDNFGFNIGSPLPIKKWWNGYVNMNIYQLHNRASFGEGKTIDLKFNSISLYMQQTFTLSKKLNFELSGWYNGPGVWGATFKNSALGGMDVAMKLDVFKGRGNLRIAYGDLLRTMHWRGVSEYGGLFLDVRGGWESQLFRVNFSWKFGNDQLKTKERKDGSEDLNKRVH